MNLSLAAIRRLIPDINNRPLTVEDFYRACRILKIKVHEIPLRVDGFYMVTGGRAHIYLDCRLRGLRWLETAFHELSHALLHSPPSVTVAFFCKVKPDSKEDREAELFASIMLLPEPLFREQLADGIDFEEEGFTKDIVENRAKAMSYFGI